MSQATRTGADIAEVLTSEQIRSPHRRLALWSLVAGIALVVACGVSLMAGATHSYGIGTLWTALTGHSDPLTEANIRDLRLPRTIVGVLIGASLGVSGALIQGVTRNPIVESSIIGVNSGAALAVGVVTYTVGTAGLMVHGVSMMPFAAFAGAACAVGLVYALVSGADVTPGRIALAGVTVAILANALVMSVVILNDNAVRLLLRYLVGGLDLATWSSVWTLLPYTALGLAASFALARAVTVVSLGDDVARGLGVRVGRIRLLSLATVVVLAGSAVAVAGPIAMVGLLVPHVARWLVGLDYHHVLALSALLGAVLLIGSDVVSRFVVPGVETPVGVLTAVLGTPYFVFLARRERGIA